MIKKLTLLAFFVFALPQQIPAMNSGIAKKIALGATIGALCYFVLRQGYQKLFNTLNFACARGDLQKVARLLASGVAINASRPDGATALHIATRYERKDVVEFLLKHGASVNAQNNRRVTPLHVACVFGSKDSADLLLKNGAYINAQAWDGSTPLHLAITYKHPAIADLLLQHGASVDIKDEIGNTSFHNAATDDVYEIAQLLASSSPFPHCLQKGAGTAALKLQEQCLLAVLQNIDNFDETSLKSVISCIAHHLDDLDPKHNKILDLLVDQAPLHAQRELVKLWKEEKSTSTTLIKSKQKLFLNAHCDRYFRKLQETLALESKYTHRAVQLANNPDIFSLFAGIAQAPSFDKLDEPLQQLIIKNLKQRFLMD